MAKSRRPDVQSAEIATPAARRAPAPDPVSAGWRHQLECGLLAYVAMLESAEAMHRFLLDSTHQARERHEAVRQRVHSSRNIDQVALLESELWGFDADLAARYWQEVAETVTHMNAELQTQVSEAFEHWIEDTQASAGALAERAMPAGFAPLTAWFAPFGSAAP